jgi:primosomal protein N' (replication factor Y) (superfamily II helicase)
MPLFLISVALPIPVRKLFDYLPTTENPDPALYKPGQRCLVPFGNRKLTGVIVSCHQHTAIPPGSLKAIVSLLDTEPFLPESTLAVYQWIAQYYHAPLGEVICSALPPVMRKPKQQSELYNKVTSVIWRTEANTCNPATDKVRGPKQRSLLAMLSKHVSGMMQKDIVAMGYQVTQLKKLQEKNLVHCQRDIIMANQTMQTIALPQLNQGQQAAFDKIKPLANHFAPILLHGVTGSGKTEVYICWLNFLLEAGADDQVKKGQALVLVPEIALTPQTIRRFRQYFGNQVISYHSAMSAKERLQSWILTQQNKARIIIGTRSALLLPFKHLLTIVVDEEHDSSFKQQDGARYNARDVAILRARLNNCPVIMGSATPSFESLYNASQSRFTKIELKHRHASQPLPVFEIINIRSRPLAGGISPPALQEITQKLEAGEQIMVFINRRGYAPVIMCTDCGWTAECSSCDARLTFHLQHNILRCHHCGRSYSPPKQCPSCTSQNVKPVGAGTERTEQVLRSHFPDVPIIRIDRDSTQTRKKLDSLLQQINSGSPCLIVGTQMLAKGHDFPNLNTVLIVNADRGLFSSDFRAVEKTAQLIMQVAGRAGRHFQRGQVLLQTQLPEHPIIQAISHHNYEAIYKVELDLRRQAKLPPVYQLCIIRADATDMTAGIETLASFKDEIASLAGRSVRLLGPVSSVLQRKHNRYHSLLWVLAKDKGTLRKLLHDWLGWREKIGLKSSQKVKWQLDVDPSETM